MASLRLTNSDPFAGLEEIVQRDVALAPHTWYRLGGPAKYLIQPRSHEELQLAAQRCAEANLPIFVLGLGANLLVSDHGVSGAVFKFDHEHWRTARIHGSNIEIGAGADIQKLVLKTCRAALTGIECLAGIPGTIGGAVRMNAGGKFGEIGSVVRRVTVMDREGTIFERHKDDLLFEYRSTNIAAPFILSAELALEEDDLEVITRRMKEIWMYKRNSQPLNSKNAGCTFKNPPGESAGAIIDRAGLKGLASGGAQVSEKHANFIVAHPGCSADDVQRLIKLVQEKVLQKTGIALQSEIKIWT